MTPEEIRILVDNKIIPDGCPQAQIDFFAKVCEKKKLDPLLRQIHLVERRSKDFSGNWVKSYTIQAGIDGMRALAQRNAKIKAYKRWVEKREDDIYGICEIDTYDRGLYRDELPFNEYKQVTKDGKLNSFWEKFPQTMIKKCAEESVLRMMTPEDLSGVYGDEEMMQADSDNGKPKELPPSQIKNYADEIKACKTLDELRTLADSMNEEEKTAYKTALKLQGLSITEADIEKSIKALKKNSKTRPMIEEVIQNTKDKTKKRELIDMYNSKLKALDIDEEYSFTPFEEVV